LCGYPDGNLSRQSGADKIRVAAGVNACLDRVNEPVCYHTQLGKREDLVTPRKRNLRQNWQLYAVAVDAVEAVTAELEANQFSTTTKLAGEVVVAGIVTGENVAGRI